MLSSGKLYAYILEFLMLASLVREKVPRINGSQYIQHRANIIRCIENCDKNEIKKSDPTKPIKLMISCTGSSCDKAKYKWSLVPDPRNTKQSFEADEIIGDTALKFTIKENVLPHGEQYEILLTITVKTEHTLTFKLNMDKCSKKFPCGGDSGIPVPPDYVGDNSFEEYIAGLNPSHLESLARSELDQLNTLDKKSAVFKEKRKELLLITKYLPVRDEEEIKFCSDILKSTIKESFPVIFEPVAAKLVIEVARQLINGRLALLKKSTDPKAMSNKVKDMSKEVLSLTKVALNISKDQLISHRPDKEETIQNATVEAPFQEDYPVYDDFDVHYLGKHENFEAIGENIVKMIESVAEANVRTMQGRVTKEETLSDDICILNILDDPSKTSNKIYKICDVSFYVSANLSTELKSQMKLSAISLGVLKKNAFWWKTQDAVAYVVYVEIDDFEKNAFEASTELNNPIIFYMNVEHGKTELVDGVFKIRESQTEILTEDISLFQLFPLKRIRTVMIQFEKLKDNEEIKVVILKNEIPRIEYFKNTSQFIKLPRNGSTDEKFTIIKHINIDEGSFGYVGVIPTQKTLEVSGKVQDGFRFFNYSVRFTRVSCDLWDQDNIRWTSSECSVHDNTTSKTMYCSCYHTSIFAASSTNIETRRLEDLEVLFLIDVEYNFVVLITVCVILFIFLLAWLFAIWRQRKLRRNKKVLFLLDNRLDLANDFEYLICVRTGLKNLAGTTANIGIQIFGSLANSDRHILRGHYEPVLQQGSEDWFYLLAPTNLGELQSIDLWTDCHGLRISWYCKLIEIHSLHEDRKWIFEVHKWFTVLSDNIYSTISGSVEGLEMVRTRCDYAKYGIKSHIWITPFVNLGDSPFTYLERLAVILSIILLNLLMAMVFLGVPYPGISGQFGRGHFSYEFLEFGMSFAGGLVSFLISWILIYLFDQTKSSESENGTRKWRLPKLIRTYHTVARVLLITLIIVSLGILLIFGIWFNYISSLIWVPIFMTGISLSILFELIRVCLTAAILKKGTKRITHKLDFSEIEQEKELLFKCFGDKGMRMFFYELYHPISDMQGKIKKEKELQRLEMRSVIIDIIMFTFYIIILLNIILLNRDHMSHRLTTNVEKIFIHDEFIREFKYKDINSDRGLYRYLRKIFFPALYTSNWYGDYNSSESGLLIDFSTKLLGIPRVRQQRVKPNSCGLHPSMVGPAESQRCHADLSLFNEDRMSYAPRWEEWEDVPRGASGVESRKIWMYQDGYESVSTAYAGELRIYFSGGYVANFGRSLENSLLVLAYIENNEWIDARTRALFFEAYFYNANQNLFCFLTLVIERSATGKFITNYQARTSRLLFMYGELAIRSFIIFSALIIMMLFFSWRKYKEYRVDIWTSFLMNVWNVIDILIIITALIFVLVYLIRSVAVSNLISILEESAHNEFISFNHVLYWDDAVTILATVLVTISTIRLWKMLRFLQIFRVCETTLVMAARYLLAVAFISGVLVFAYSTFGFIIFGPYSENFRSILHGFVTLLLHALGFSIYFNYTVLQESYWAIGPTYYVVFMLILFYIINIFIAIIIVAYEAARDYIDECEKQNLVSYNLLDYLKDEWRYFRSKTKGRELDNHLRAGEEHIEIDEIKNVAPNRDVFRKQVRINTDRMTSIHHIAADILEILLDRHSGLENIDISDYDELIAELVSNVCNKEEEDNRNKIHDDRFVVIPDDDIYKYIATQRLEDMCTIVDYLFRNSGKMSQPDFTSMVDKTVASIVSMNAVVLEMIRELENLSKKLYLDKSTNVTFDDFGLEVIDDEDNGNERRTSRYREEEPEKVETMRRTTSIKRVQYDSSVDKINENREDEDDDDEEDDEHEEDKKLK